VAALAVPIVVKPVFILFLYIAHVLGWVMTRVILSVLFYLVITPIGLILKLFGKKFLDMKFFREKESYWIETGEEEGVKSYEIQY
jgi:multisubunit Na+/H+ antiporter MnhG subunit